MIELPFTAGAYQHHMAGNKEVIGGTLIYTFVFILTCNFSYA